MSLDYSIGNVKINEILDQFGTPVFVYDSEKIIDQYNRFKNSLDVKHFKINYACKALTNLSILKLMNALGAGLDTVSIQELKLGLMAGFDVSDIIYTPNSVSIEEICEAMETGVKINIDNIEMLEFMGHKYPDHPICIRINPHIMAGGNSNISVGHIDSKFGISIHQVPLVRRLVKSLNMNIEGLHMHTGSDILDVEVFLRASDILFNIAHDFDDLQYIDFGSGFKVKYREGDTDTDIELFGKEISARFNRFCKNYGRDISLMFEPGKYLVSESGKFFAKVNVVKQTTSTVFIGIDSGFNHFVRPMFYNAHHKIVNVSNPEGDPKIYTVVGYICETDTFAWNRKISETKKGDILCFSNAGAYCFSMASNYNSRFRPAEVLIHNGEAHLIRRRETLEDLIKTLETPELAFD